jgi:hypothetical protein
MATPKVISDPERKLLAAFAVLVLPVGFVGSMILAISLGDKTLPTTYWDKLLTITGVAALPLVAMAVLVLRGVTKEGPRYWGKWIFVGGLIAFAIALTVILICLYELVTTPAAGKKPGASALWVATLGTGLTLGAVAASVAAAALDKIDELSSGKSGTT